MSSERLNFNEYRERSAWNLFQKKNVYQPEIQTRNAYVSLGKVDIERNPPNPVIRPLLVRPQARDEPTFLWKEKKKNSIHMDTSGCNTSDRKTSTSLTLNEFKNDEFNKWRQFIFAYAQDMYNLSCPPSPPTKLRTQYFIPPRPFNEAERVSALRSYNILPKYVRNLENSQLSLLSNKSDQKNKDFERLQRLVIAARDFFSTPIALISLIDENRCYFKCESGLNMSDIDRDITFCTHTLLSTEPMVILDASKDWRFKGNPLVINPPYLRFYAGAPIITPDGYPIGTISVIDTNARLSFSSQDRRPLSQFARMAMDEIKHLSQLSKSSLESGMEKMSLKSCVSFSELDSVSAINDYQGILNNKDTLDNCTQKSTSDFISEDSHEILKVRPSQVIKKTSQTCVDTEGIRSYKDSSAFFEVSSHSEVDEKCQVMQNNYKFSNLKNSSLSQIKYDKEQKSTLYSSLISKDNFIFPNCFKDELENETCSNENNHVGFKQTFSDIDKKENSQVLKNSELTPPSTPINLKINFINSPDKNTISKEDHTLNLRTLPPNASHPSIFATHVIACTLGLDLVYIVQILPDNSTFLKSRENENKSNVCLDIIASWGLPTPPPALDPVLHLRALRSEAGLIYRNPLHLSEDCLDYKIGILVPLWRDDIDESNTQESLKKILAKSNSGVVLAGFAKKERTSKGFSSDEIQYLRKFGGVLEKVLKLSNTK